MNVKVILSRKGRGVLTIEPTAALGAAIKLLAQQRIGALIVTDGSGHIAGVLSERDVVRALDEKGARVLNFPVAEIMTRKVETCAETTTVDEIMERMTRGKFRHVPVTQEGALAGIVSIGDVVKERLEELENALVKVEAVTAALAHEVRQPLAAITANSGAALRFLEKTPPNRDEVRMALSRIVSDVRRTSEVFDTIRALFRTTDQVKQRINLNELIIEVLQSLSGELKDHGIVTDSKLMSDLPPIEGNKGQLRQVLQNLVHNALEAMATSDRNRMLRVKSELQGQDAIRVAVEDSGPGIDPKLLDRVFDAFVTTKTQGMGLGLALCRMIIERHGGQLSALSDGRNGAEFQFVLPTAFRR